jgi:hypothetical protein
VAVVLGAVRGIDVVVEVGGNVKEDHILLQIASPDSSFPALLAVAEPSGAVPVCGADIKVAADANDPDRHRISECAIRSKRRYLQLFCCSDLVEFVARPRRHRRVSRVISLVL